MTFKAGLRNTENIELSHLPTLPHIPAGTNLNKWVGMVISLRKINAIEPSLISKYGTCCETSIALHIGFGFWLLFILRLSTNQTPSSYHTHTSTPLLLDLLRKADKMVGWGGTPLADEKYNI